VNEQPTPEQLRHLCAVSLQRWSLELAQRLSPAEAAMLLKASAIAAACSAFGTAEAAEMLREDADRLAAMSGPCGHA